MSTPPPPPSAPPPPPPPPPAAAPAKGGNRTLIIILCILGGLFVIIGGCVATCTYVVHKKAKEFSGDMRKDPQFATVNMIASLNPNLLVVSKDADARKITIKNKKTGEVVTLDLNNFSAENMEKAMQQFSKGQKISQPAQADSESAEPAAAPAVAEEPPAPAKPAPEKISPARASAQAAVLKRFPSFLPAYRGGKTLQATLQTLGGKPIGNYIFTTDDPVEKVADFYEKSLTGAGFTIAGRDSGTDDNGATAAMLAQHTDPQMGVTVAIKIDQGKTHVDIMFTKEATE
jgi:predicted nuclease of predicted toxin-antitoxin system